MVAFTRFAELHPEERRTTEELFRLANQVHGEPFLTFALLWMSFNGWMACVTGLEQDAAMIRTLGNNTRLSSALDKLMANQPGFSVLVNTFAASWPIFNSSDVRSRLGSGFAVQWDDRADFVASVIHDPRIRRRPPEWSADDLPKWSDLLQAVYQIRCNMFHGVKSPANEWDRELVDLAFNSLNGFIRESRCFGWHDN